MWFERKKEKLKSRGVSVENRPYLIIVESPYKCMILMKHLGLQYNCIASKGHIRQISKLQGAQERYQPVFEIIPSLVSHVDEMKREIGRYIPENIFLATDDDREGEAIAWHICQVFQLSSNTKRIVFREMTADALKHAVANPIRVRMNIVMAQQARQVLDRMIGFRVSSFLRKLVSGDNLSAGRCQTPTLRLISEQQDTETSISLYCSFLSNQITGKLDYRFKSEDEIQGFMEASKTFTHILDVTVRNQKENPPPPFNTSLLLQTAYNELGFCAQEIMGLSQLLYQGGYITYMRTAGQQYSSSFMDQCTHYIATMFGKEYVFTPKQEDTQEAIRVTDIAVEKVLDERCNALYSLIRRRSLEACMCASHSLVYSIRISNPLGYYLCEKETTLFLGWKHLSEKPNSSSWSFLYQYHLKPVSYGTMQTKLESRISHYNEASLIRKMDSIGIGRASTYAIILGVLKKRKYALIQSHDGITQQGKEFRMVRGEIQVTDVQHQEGVLDNRFCIQKLGKHVIDCLYTHFGPLFCYTYSRKMELELDALETASDFYSICETCDLTLRQCTQPLMQKMKIPLQIDANHMLHFGKFGPYIRSQTGSFFGLKQFMIDPTNVSRSEINWGTEPLGVYENHPVYLKKGPYGLYVQWGDIRESVPRSYETALLPCLIQYIENKRKKRNILRKCSTFTIRTGKYGPYVDCEKRLYSLRGCLLDYIRCDEELLIAWICKKENKDI